MHAIEKLEAIRDGRKAGGFIEKARKLAERNIVWMTMNVKPDMHHYLPITDERYEPPLGHQVNEVLGQIIGMGYTMDDIELMLNAQTGDAIEWGMFDYEVSNIDYPTWRLMLHYAGLSLDLMLADKKVTV